MKSQFAAPVIVESDGRPTSLEKIALTVDGGGDYDESWLQQLLFSAPTLLPIEEIEATFADVCPVCREMATGVGPLDLVFINERGLLTFVECKLWRNPEARRKVIGQILDYAQDISRWSYENLDAAVRKADGSSGRSLWEIARDHFNLSDEAVFIDRVTKHLRNGTFLLLVAGDGIRENTEAIATYLTRHAGIGFALGLVEEQIFRLPGSDKLLVQPRILAKTVELGRLIVRTEQTGIIVEDEAKPVGGAKSSGSKEQVVRNVTENLFVEEVAGTSELAARLHQFFDRIKMAGLKIESPKRKVSLIIRSPMIGVNLLTLSLSGEVYNRGVGNRPLGLKYLQELSRLIPGTMVRTFNDGGWLTTVARMDGNPIRIEDVVHGGEALVDLLGRTAQEFDALPDAGRSGVVSDGQEE